MIAGDDPLRELPKAMVLDHVAQLGLADEDELQKLVLVRVHVGEHPQFFERLEGQVLRFVYDQDDVAALGIFGQEEILKELEQPDIVEAGGVPIESVFSVQRTSSPRPPCALEIRPTVTSSSRALSRACTRVVLPVPTSPVITVIGARDRIPYSRTENARR